MAITGGPTGDAGRRDGTTDGSTYWDDYAEAYDEEPDHGLRDPATRTAWRQVLQGALPAPASDVVDLACGTGSLTVLASELGHRVVGMDLSEQMLARARDKTAGMPVRLVRGDVADPALPEAGADVVLARHIVWTLPDPHAALGRWVRLLRPAGRLVLIEGRWSSVGDDGWSQDVTAADRAMPWAGGVRAEELAGAVTRLVDGIRVEVVPLTDPVLWGRVVDDERYLLLARLG